MSNVLQQIEHLAEYVFFSISCNQLLNPTSSNHLSTNVTLYFLLEISVFFAKNNKDILVETIGEKFRLCRHIQKSKLHCNSSKTFQNNTLKYRN